MLRMKINQMTEETEEEKLKGIIAKQSWHILDLQKELKELREDCAKIAEQSVIAFGTPLQANDARDLRSIAIARRIRGQLDPSCNLQK